MQKTGFIGLRVDSSIADKLDSIAELYNVSKSTIIRDLLGTCDVTYPILKAEQDTTSLEKRVRESLKGRVPNNLEPLVVVMVGEMVSRIMTEIAEQMIAEKKD